MVVVVKAAACEQASGGCKQQRLLVLPRRWSAPAGVCTCLAAWQALACQLPLPSMHGQLQVPGPALAPMQPCWLADGAGSRRCRRRPRTLLGTSVRYSAGMIWSVSMFCGHSSN